MRKISSSIGALRVQYYKPFFAVTDDFINYCIMWL